VRAVLAHAIDREPAKGERFVKIFIEQVRALGGFRPGSPECPGEETIAALRASLCHRGFDLDPEGHLPCTRRRGLRLLKRSRDAERIREELAIRLAGALR
jgi:hypothetical protein